ncbi:pentapeptide repeat-containing protein [Pseudonocardia phyllosphaerae]|uniref:pentapeptide repeat-containing protein n=1 Tax=Pseudonocardia phyllosphaerae TaxID=3390502 RepID=UPI0039794945
MRPDDLAAAARSGTPVTGPALDEADLHDTGLAGLQLTGGSLAGANLRSVRLDGARLYGADLRTSDLGEITADTPAELRGAVVSPAQAAAVCTALGLTVLE